MAFIEKSYTFYTPAGTVLKNANVSVYFAKTSTAARVFDAGQNLKDTAPQLTTDDTGYVLMYFDDDDFQTGQAFDLVASPDAKCNPTENEVRLTSVTLTTNWSEIADDNGHKPADDSDVTLDQLSGKGVNVCHARYSSFEEASKPPTDDADGTVTQDSGVSYFGGNSLKMAATGDNHRSYLGTSGTDYNVKITPNKIWIVSAYNRCSQISKDLQIYVKNSFGSLAFYIDDTSHGTANTWKRVSGVINLSNSSATQCIIRLDNDGGNGCNMWWDGIMLEEQLGTLEVPSAYALPSAIMEGWDSQADNTGTAIENSAASMLYNWNLTIPDVDEMPAGIYPVEGITDHDQVDFLDSGNDSIKILSTPDTTVGYGFPAIPIDDKQKYTITIRHKSSAASTDGLYLRLNQYNAALPVGKTHIGSAGGTNTQTRTNYLTLFSGAMPGTSWIVNSYTYTPTAGTKYASFSMYNWTPATAGVEYHVDYVLMYVSYKKADNTEHVNDSENQSTYSVDIHGNLDLYYPSNTHQMLRFYDSSDALRGYISVHKETGNNFIYLSTLADTYFKLIGYTYVQINATNNDVQLLAYNGKVHLAGGNAVIYVENNAIRSDTNNTDACGTASYKWSDVYTVLQHTGDILISDTHCPICKKRFKKGDSLILTVLDYLKQKDGDEIDCVPMHLHCADKVKNYE